MLALAAAGPLHAEEPVRVFAAASLTNALTEAAALWRRQGHPAASLAFGSSATLARQIEAGAPADLFASADLSWMDSVEQRGRIEPGTRAQWLGNDLVMIVPRGRSFRVEVKEGFDLAGAFEGKLCTGEPGVVPAGTYARQALESLGWWKSLEGRIVGTDDVRSALTFVGRGECALGIVYATDASASQTVEVLARFPPASHAPIVYPFALVKGARPEARGLLAFLQGREAAAVFVRHGFAVR